MTTDIPLGIATPDKLETRLGILTLRDGVPDIGFSRCPAKAWNMLIRLYGPLQPWFDKTWRPGNPELVEKCA